MLDRPILFQSIKNPVVQVVTYQIGESIMSDARLIGPKEIAAVMGHCFGLKGATKAVLTALVVMADKATGDVRETVASIARRAGVADSSAERSIKRLLNSKFIRSARSQPAAGRRGRPASCFRLQPKQWRIVGENSDFSPGFSLDFSPTTNEGKLPALPVGENSAGLTMPMPHACTPTHAPALTEIHLDNLTGSDHGEDLTGRLTEANTKAARLEGVQGETLPLLPESYEATQPAPEQQSLAGIDTFKAPAPKRKAKAPIELSKDEQEIVDCIAADKQLAPIIPEDIRPELAQRIIRAGNPKLDFPYEVNRAGTWLLTHPKKAKTNGARYLLNWFKRAVPEIRPERRPEKTDDNTADYTWAPDFDPNDPEYLEACKIRDAYAPIARERAAKELAEVCAHELSPEMKDLFAKHNGHPPYELIVALAPPGSRKRPPPRRDVQAGES